MPTPKNNREIKFRAWDILSKVMIQPEDDYDMKLNGEIGYYKRGCSDWWMKMEDVILLQFTGLKDKNGKEIYEGDIIRFNNFLKDKKGKIIECIKEISIPDIYRDRDSIIYPKILGSSIEVIGNVWENPDLLR